MSSRKLYNIQMSGHSKWATIKRQKGATDARRGQLFTKLSNAITIAVKQSGGIDDPESNFKLRLAVDRARSANVPKENIERAIQKAKGAAAGSVEELLYEGFGPSGVAIIITAVTDNKQRTVSTIKSVFDKNGGTLGAQGSVSYLFSKRGVLVVKKTGLSQEALLTKGIAAGVMDMEDDRDSVFFYVEPQQLQHVRKALLEEGLEVESAEFVYLPLSEVEHDTGIQHKVLSLIEKLEELDDVQEVYTNLKNATPNE